MDDLDPRFVSRLRQNRHEHNSKRMLVFCLLFVVFQLVTLFSADGYAGYIGLLNLTLDWVLAGHAWLAVKLVAIGSGVVYCVLYILAWKKIIRTPNVLDILLHACLLTLSAAQLGLCLFAVGTSYFALYVIVYLLMLAVLPVLPRLQSLIYNLVFAGSCYIGWICIATFLMPTVWLGNNPLLKFILFSDVLLVFVALAASLCVAFLNFDLVKRETRLQLALEDQAAEVLQRIEEETHELREKARVAEVANLAKTRFLTSVSHQMRTAITTILGMVFFAKEEDDAASRQASLAAIDEASHKLRDVVENIIDTTKIELDFAGDDINQEFDLIAADAARPARDLEKIEAPDLSGYNILIVEDLETNRFVLREFLRATHATVDEAENGKIAVEMFAASPVNHYAFIFMDLLMPEMNGHEATRTIRKMERADAADIPIVAVSANAFKEDIEDSLAAGMDAHLAKPVEQTSIFRVLIERLSLDSES